MAIGYWGQLLRDLGVEIHGMLRYMDDVRTLLAPFRAGWRWNNGKIQYCLRWEREDSHLSNIERTRRVLGGTMGCIEEFLEFTTETEEDFPDGWLPTLDTAWKVSEDNCVLFKFWEKPTNTNRTLNKRTAMGENQKITILTQEVVRRLGNTMEGMKREEYEDIIDMFSQKLINSGYQEDQVRRIVVSGIKGWGSKVARCKAEGKRVRRTAKDSLEQRSRTKLLGSATWFKKRGSPANRKDTLGKKRSRINRGGKGAGNTIASAPRSVLFVEQTPGGELASRLKELFRRLEPTLGFWLKVVERTGRSLQSNFPLTNLWDGTPCGREQECIPCYQGAEAIQNCTKNSVLYENICATCVPEARGKEQVKEEQLEGSRPTLYFLETSRSIQERTKEYWEAYKKRKEDSHIWKHQQLEHEGQGADFVMKVIGSFRSALSLQVSEAVRIRRRGGAGSILNSKTEFNRCHIPRLRVEDEEEAKQREEQLLQEREQREVQLDKEQAEWEAS